jgi:GNAT superfamily N-acetyltransferase
VSRFEQIREVLAETVEALTDETAEFEAGWVARTRSLPRVWTLNQLHVTVPVDAPSLMAAADRYQGDLGYRHVVVDDDRVADSLETELKAAGWVMDKEVLMSLDAPADRVVETTRVVELDEDEMIGLMRRWHVEERPESSEEGTEQVMEYTRREGRLWEEIRFGVRDDRGAPVSSTKLRGRNGVGWVEDVYTLPRARGGGAARELVTHASELARRRDHDFTFIMADDNDWPKTLYQKIGFRPVGWTRTFHRP